MMDIGLPRAHSNPGAFVQRRDWRRIVLLSLSGLAILLFGIAIGVVGMVFHLRNAAFGEGGNPRRIGERLAESVTGDITLTKEEDARINAVIADRVMRIDDLFHAYGGKFQAEFDGMCKEICAILGNDRARMWEHCVHRDFGAKAAERIRANRPPLENQDEN